MTQDTSTAATRLDAIGDKDVGVWHSHPDGFWRYLWNAATRRWTCEKCGVTL